VCLLWINIQACQLHMAHGVPLLIAPSTGIFYCCLFHRNAVIVDKICSILTQ